MDNTDPEFDIDPALAAAMGFNSFGGNTKQKRKFGANDGFVDPSLGNAAHATGANNTALPSRAMKSAAPSAESAEQASKRPHVSSELYDPKSQESPSLELLRQGVKNTNGDMVYFLPSFIEDPWTGLKAQ